ncbi:DUF969 domain-containing protein [Alicyclobacillus acidoterrestris]|uniref:DUF969 domain-containing protein n=1 Tax=Alicyclobacillus acidoterrestris (strain ATCC 49025 / DSM 3922 / CIP 106132 / NCIMB 13137 / GD3B) TaxID=1356854 RepID=T0CU07_ALIAG|nr:DUF969 domain-containing protein [Alicyclobacillus acidoterrestris]EPZ41031.1 hypothetical protein N007_17550 [Alicyclobacillus acidoterrestris ATCC 49025]UNO47805.1 DUF969 domain-containing protein [Alicyclobacillus acidoterrestris]GEO27191.1 permease [Alicyclobacillus acidoterrestris]
MVLIGVAVVIVGFLIRLNPLLVVIVAGLVTGLIAHQSLYSIITQFGEAFETNRYMAIFIATLPVIGLLERHGLREQAERLIGKIRAATTGRILMLYLLLREVTAALGITSIGGAAQTVRPLIAPMAEGAVEAKYGSIPEDTQQEVRAHAAAVDNIGVFFGEDIFIAVGAVLLMKGFFDQNHIKSTPIDMGLWAIPTAAAALVIHCIRLYLLDRRIKRRMTAASTSTTSTEEGANLGDLN